MRVLMVSSLWPPEVLGGAEQYAGALAERLTARGDEVGVVTLGVPGDDVVATVPPWPYPLRDYATQGPLRRALFHAADLTRPDTRRVLDRALDEFRPDVVHSHVVQGMGVTALTETFRRGVGHVHTLHDYWLLCQRNAMVQRDGTACAARCGTCRVISEVRNRRIASRPPEVVVAVSEAIAARHLAELAWMRNRTRVVYNPVEPARPRAARPPGEPVVFGFIGRLGIDKGIRTLVDAFGRADVGSARLVVAGRGPDAAVVEGVAGIDYRGWVSGPEKDRLFDEIDCLVVPSQWEDPAPLVVNEARSRGVPVIGSTAGGIPELVAPVNATLLFPPGESGELARSMTRFAADPHAFVPVPESLPLDWDGHLDAIRTAYRDAIAAAALTERDRDGSIPGLPLTDGRGSFPSTGRG
jgi:glycosyltransferase involved in cell wall biosynthesis